MAIPKRISDRVIQRIWQGAEQPNARETFAKLDKYQQADLIVVLLDELDRLEARFNEHTNTPRANLLPAEYEPPRKRSNYLLRDEDDMSRDRDPSGGF